MARRPSTEQEIQIDAELLAALVTLARETEVLAHKHFGHTNGLPGLYAARCLVSKYMDRPWDDVVRELESAK